MTVTVHPSSGRRIGDALVFAHRHGETWYGLVAFEDGRRVASGPQESERAAWRAAGRLAVGDQEARRAGRQGA